MTHRILALLAAAALLLGGCRRSVVSDQQFDIAAQRTQASASAQRPEQPGEPLTTLNLAYSVSDSLNPFQMKTQMNRMLTPLLYDSLTRVDKTWRPQNILAEEITVENKLCTVKLRSGIVFSDGSPLTGKDVIYSITTAMASGTDWKTTLQNISGCSVNDDGAVEIRLYNSDADFASLLSFPIIKEGTAANDYPVGVSQYFASGTWGGNGITLARNPIYWNQDALGSVQKIRLTSVSDPDALSFSLRTGDIDLMYSDLSEGDMGSSAASGVPVSLNSLVYIGVNGNRGLLSDAQFRQAISLAINRDELVAKAYIAHARATLYPFNPEFYRMEDLELSTPRELARAEELLVGMGLTQKDENGYRLRNGQPLTLRLLVNSENACRNAAATLLTEQLRQLGIQVTVESQSFTQYQASLARRDYDLYIGETRLMDNMDFSALLSGGVLGYSTPYIETLSEFYQAYRATGTGIGTFCEAFAEQSPFIPLVFRQGQVSFNRSFDAQIVATEQNLFYNLSEW
ncbi:peptide ABC transporter substrate-binding protein [Anaerotruncus colihominis]|uniref:Peptide ABC transporter substrate-binding protein n=1 Tax=Anaerotruncus colihominis TaxID=169435 RepID=A0A845RJA3_9FIRM|nr:peptide ABC transporter substrate-binding protein [Anaerotruncus colihominis]NBI79008.1 peptide ABC transporter substrate-binding protein [Anaerotruncus colihominis]